MAGGIYRVIRVGFWASRDVRGLSTDAKLLALYLATSPHSHLSGIYWLPLAHAAVEIGYPIERVSASVAELIASGFLRYDHDAEVAWVVSMFGYQCVRGAKNVCHVLRHLSGLPLNALTRAFTSHYGELLGCEMETPEGASNRVSIPYSADRVSIPYCSSSNPDTDTDTASCSSDATTPQRALEPPARSPTALSQGERPALFALAPVDDLGEPVQPGRVTRGATRKPRARSKAEGRADGEAHVAVVAGFDAQFTAATGARPGWDGRTGKLVKALLAKAGAAGAGEVLRRAEIMFAARGKWPAEHPDIGTLSTHWDKFAAPRDVRVGHAAARTGTDYGTNGLKEDF